MTTTHALTKACCEIPGVKKHLGLFHWEKFGKEFEGIFVHSIQIQQ